MSAAFISLAFSLFPVHPFCQKPSIICARSEILPASVAPLDAPSNWRPGGRGFNPRRGRQHSFVEIDHEIFSTVILSLPLIQEGQLSVSGLHNCKYTNSEIRVIDWLQSPDTKYLFL